MDGLLQRNGEQQETDKKWQGRRKKDQEDGWIRRKEVQRLICKVLLEVVLQIAVKEVQGRKNTTVICDK